MKNLSDMVIPIIDVADKLGMPATQRSVRRAIVVAEVNVITIGLLVDLMSAIVNGAKSRLQPVPDISIFAGTGCADGNLAQPEGMICILNHDRMSSVQRQLSGPTRTL